jgi:hypothetical protein
MRSSNTGTHVLFLHVRRECDARLMLWAGALRRGLRARRRGNDSEPAGE